MDAVTQDFIELSVLLSGRQNLLKDEHYAHFAGEYIRRLRGAGGDLSPQFEKLLATYHTLTAVEPKPPVDDALLAKLVATPEFKANEFAARQIVNIVYFSQFQAEDRDDAAFLDGGFYEHGEVWPLIMTHPIGFSNQPHGYWTANPNEVPAVMPRRR